MPVPAQNLHSSTPSPAHCLQQIVWLLFFDMFHLRRATLSVEGHSRGSGGRDAQLRPMYEYLATGKNQIRRDALFLLGCCDRAVVEVVGRLRNEYCRGLRHFTLLWGWGKGHQSSAGARERDRD